METIQPQGSTHRDMGEALIRKCWKDPAFQKAIVSDPRGVIEKQLGQKLPPNLKIVIYEEDANTLHFSLPPAPANLSELSEDELERVSGGTEVGIFVATVFLAAATIAGAGVTALNAEKIGW
jgi:nitrile hydratase alpha subunit